MRPSVREGPDVEARSPRVRVSHTKSPGRGPRPEGRHPHGGTRMGVTRSPPRSGMHVHPSNPPLTSALQLRLSPPARLLDLLRWFVLRHSGGQALPRSAGNTAGILRCVTRSARSAWACSAGRVRPVRLRLPGAEVWRRATEDRRGSGRSASPICITGSNTTGAPARAKSPGAP